VPFRVGFLESRSAEVLEVWFCNLPILIGAIEIVSFIDVDIVLDDGALCFIAES
jgi:hypothetical protein